MNSFKRNASVALKNESKLDCEKERERERGRREEKETEKEN